MRYNNKYNNILKQNQINNHETAQKCQLTTYLSNALALRNNSLTWIFGARRAQVFGEVLFIENVLEKIV